MVKFGLPGMSAHTRPPRLLAGRPTRCCGAAFPPRPSIVKDVQGQMRHSQVSMSLMYGKVIPKSVAEQVNKLAEELTAKLDSAPPSATNGVEPVEPGNRWWARQDSNL